MTATTFRASWLALTLASVLAAAGCTKSADGAAAPGPGGKAAGADRPIPVLVSEAATRDVPIYLEGLGTVTAYKTVNVRAQVDGRLDKVLFREGQAVKRNEILAQIDPRPFQILLEQGQAALTRDQAQLDGAKRNLDRYEAVGGEHL
jgi:multidrug efflux system membrane fusion protein